MKKRNKTPRLTAQSMLAETHAKQAAQLVDPMLLKPVKHRPIVITAIALWTKYRCFLIARWDQIGYLVLRKDGALFMVNSQSWAVEVTAAPDTLKRLFKPHGFSQEVGA